MSNYYSISFASILVVAVAAPAVAQVEPETVADRQGVISYTPADFAAARPKYRYFSFL